MAFFEYGYRFSVDEEIIDRYGCNISDLSGPVVFETRIHYSVRGISGERKRIDWECFLTGCSPYGETEECLLLINGRRLKDCWMPNPHIRTMIQQFVFFAKQALAKQTPRPIGSHGKLPVAVDVEVCTLQRQGEEMVAAVERAMKPAHLPPLRFYPTDEIGLHVRPAAFMKDHYDIVLLKAMPTVRVEDVEKASSVMNVCLVCSRRPIIGTQILTLLCGHAFHLHCVAERLLEKTNSCPTCNHQPAFNEHLSPGAYYKFDNVDYDPANPDRSDEDDDYIDSGDIGFWTHHLPSTSGAAETFWSQLLDDDESNPAHAAETFCSQHLDDDDDDDPDYDPAAPDDDSDSTTPDHSAAETFLSQHLDDDDESDTDYDPAAALDDDDFDLDD